MNQFKNLDINIYNYSIREMVLLFKLTDNYNKNNVNEQKKALINEINRAGISNEKKLKVIDFIKQVAYFLQVKYRLINLVTHPNGATVNVKMQ